MWQKVASLTTYLIPVLYLLCNNHGEKYVAVNGDDPVVPGQTKYAATPDRALEKHP